ncbi:hypothetical protein LTR35_003387 [Friedmanniomyces endolithicus]|uniref:Uncharacterized protein n=1 Tax=Friedmanniomyces endolithicus TaxID=329885 RepID=A0AAN6FLW4_9PEZI|nr:hypothetical protein LTR35_003387 [Friedmanniomyces endolithicus]KAK0293182.1 hypothetical protein LTS00_007785 [Friedmanniomyces endolithicus]KAK0319517.1 hypothetical protein LTR82_009584 [Friedmanniomyces endolithicus]KAK0981450.1 hypothetical protein LTR54_015045 [Friedmanniomyces endolithicus]
MSRNKRAKPQPTTFVSREARTPRLPPEPILQPAATRPPTLCHVTETLIQRHKIRESCEAEQLFRRGRYQECAQKCREILEGEASEAIEARAHFYLSTLVVGSRSAVERAYHAKMAVEAWEAVVERTGVSWFPVDEARRQLGIVRRHCEETVAFAGDEAELVAEGGGVDGLSS